MYPARLIGSRAVSLMGLRTHFGLVSGGLANNHSGHQTLGAFIYPFHAFSLANSE
jgi:hypothetical protein